MDSITRQPNLLIKIAGNPGKAMLAMGDRRPINATFVPLFTSIRPKAVQGMAEAASWFQVSAGAQGDEVNAWDLCHHIATQGLGIAGLNTPEFAEPDLEQQWRFGAEAQQALALGATCDQPAPPNPKLPFDPNDFFWFRDANHSQLGAARDQAGDPGVGKRVRIAHLDTGYDPLHLSLPKFLRRDLQKNFVDANFPNDATDRTSGVFTNLGHGTGTIGLLAGATAESLVLGGAPNAEVVPVRVANSVVLFRNSAIARAFDYVHSLASDPSKQIHVITMSMGGLASEAWADAVNELYEMGVFIVTAAGNNFGNLPTRNIVYPARFNRVVAACGVMENGKPYADLPLNIMAGNYGPQRKMQTAIAGYSPNTPWAKLGCPKIVDHSGAGTSSSTPQIAAAAALWIQTHRQAYDAYPQGWMKVEAVRKAVFDGAGAGDPDQHLGRGAVHALKALAQPPAAGASLQPQPRDTASFPFLRVITGLGLDAQNPRLRMLELEALQLSQRSHEIESLLPDPEIDPAAVPQPVRRQILEALADAPGASQALRLALGVAQKRVRTQVAVPAQLPVADKERLERAISPPLPDPATRSLRVFAFDPLVGASLDTANLNGTTLDVRWEKNLAPGPVGEYLEVVDIDPASGCAYAPVDLNHPTILAGSGLTPSESDPRFHQQMVYAVAMMTIQHFERALGRSAMWAAREFWTGGNYEKHFVQRLRIYPHAMREANAYYSPEKKALLFGYFRASEATPGDNLPGGTVFNCLSHDVVAHETTHALLDGLHRRFREPTNPDVFAFHEAFADIVAIFQHFTMPESLKSQIARTQGNLTKQNLLGELALQFGQATGRSGALRSAIGRMEDGIWRPAIPTPQDYQNADEPHDRGAVLVAAVFDAFLNIYRLRGRDLIQLATGGTGVLPEGNIPVDLVNRLAQEASRSAAQVLNICIRALDYCPPVDITFGDYIRALITADFDLVPSDPLGYRVAFIEAFRRRGIYPQAVKAFSSEGICWQPPESKLNLDEVLDQMSLRWDLNVDRRLAWETSNSNGKILAEWLLKSASDEDTLALGFYRRAHPEMQLGDLKGRLNGFEVHSVRPVRRIGPDNQQRLDLVIEITQSWVPTDSGPRFRGGCTLIVSLETRKIRYCIRKRVAHAERMEMQRSFRADIGASNLRSSYFDRQAKGDEPFAILHR
jgi:hypothetical protein